jgi:hypothetical protein
MILELIYLATASSILGAVFTFVLLLLCWVLNVDLSTNLWLLGLPAILAVAVNIFLIEMYYRRKKKGVWGNKHF